MFNDYTIINVSRLKQAALWVEDYEEYSQFIGNVVIRITRTPNDIIILTICNGTLGIKKAIALTYVQDNFTYFFNTSYTEFVQACMGANVPAGIGG